jgi:ubiquinone/menaquinone biosynthesis C-methylase UbiE
LGSSTGFRGEVVDLYHRYRRGYPAAVLDALVDAFGLTSHDTVIDLGGGTGQLTLPLARRVGVAVGIDPEPDMLNMARRAAEQSQVGNIVWALGADADMPAMGRLLGAQSIAAVTVGQALHWMQPTELFAALAPMLRPGGGVAVITNGTPLRLQRRAWSRAVRGSLQAWLGTTLTATCGTDSASQRRYSEELVAAGFTVTQRSIEYVDDLTLEQLVGGLLSAFPVDQLPPAQERQAFAEHVRDALPNQERYTERVRVAMLLGRTCS